MSEENKTSFIPRIKVSDRAKRWGIGIGGLGVGFSIGYAAAKKLRERKERINSGISQAIGSDGR